MSASLKNSVREQLSLTGLASDAPATDCIFFGVFPDGPAAAVVARHATRLRREHGLRGTPLVTSRFHVTLYPLGTYAGVPEGLVRGARKAAATIAVPPFEVRFDRAMSFPSSRAYVLTGTSGVAALVHFQQALGIALAKHALGPGVSRRFKPHVTLLYDERLVAEHKVPPVSWAVNEFVLIHSLQGKTRHIVLGRWPLHG